MENANSTERFWRWPDGSWRCGECDQFFYPMKDPPSACPFCAAEAEHEEAAFALMRKFHKETECGKDGMHWRECERFVDSFELFDSWEAWVMERRDRQAREMVRTELEAFAAHYAVRPPD